MFGCKVWTGGPVRTNHSFVPSITRVISTPLIPSFHFEERRSGNWQIRSRVWVEETKNLGREEWRSREGHFRRPTQEVVFYVVPLSISFYGHSVPHSLSLSSFFDSDRTFNGRRKWFSSFVRNHYLNRHRNRYFGQVSGFEGRNRDSRQLMPPQWRPKVKSNPQTDKRHDKYKRN